MAVVMEAFDGCFPDCPVHPLNLTVRPWMIGFRQTMFDPVLVTDPIEDVVKSVLVTRLVGKLDAVVGQSRMDDIRNGFDQIAQELRGNHFASLPMQ